MKEFENAKKLYTEAVTNEGFRSEKAKILRGYFRALDLIQKLQESMVYNDCMFCAELHDYKIYDELKSYGEKK